MCLPAEIPSYKCCRGGLRGRTLVLSMQARWWPHPMSAEMLEMLNRTKSRFATSSDVPAVRLRPVAIATDFIVVIKTIGTSEERPVLVQAIKSFHNYATPDRCMVQRETLKGLSVARSKKRLRKKRERQIVDAHACRSWAEERQRVEWINERRRVRRKRARINEIGR
ncbi:hypothetical protein ALC62_03496 [Cyphomyrmex costatus]|uniref:Uncharacterized protein n=1 Tax=Cyphomyrmex costatus TaxID=456900 RepID=A0A151ILH2_9HYME|nr:hypothetical protein ALC62_03496 [Cyphomyrmex costatus]